MLPQTAREIGGAVFLSIHIPCRWRAEVLPIHKEVLDAYLCEWIVEADRTRAAIIKRFVEFDGTITEEAIDDGARLVVARGSIDLLGRVSVHLVHC